MYRKAFLVLAGFLVASAGLSGGCTVRVEEPANPPKIDVQLDRPKAYIDVDVDVKSKPRP